MNLKNIAILAVVVVVSSGITRYFFPKVEYRNVEVVKEVVRNDIRTVVRTIERPDGSKEIVSETVDRSTKKESKSKETIISSKPQWMVSVGTKMNTSDEKLQYDLSVQRRIIGPFFLGATASTDKTIGVSVGMEF